MCYLEDENGEERPLTVTEYIASELKEDELQFHDPLHRLILKEAEAHLHDNGFTTERYFIAHPDPPSANWPLIWPVNGISSANIIPRTRK